MAQILESPTQLSQQGTTFLRTCFNGINVLSGLGMLSISYALSQAGWVSVINLFLLAAICCYTGILLCRCMQLDPESIKTYPDIANYAFGPKAKVIVYLLINVELYLTAVDYLILEGDNLHKMFPHVKFKVGALEIGGKQAFVVLTSLVILPTTWLRNLGRLAYVSAGGILASFVLIACIFWVGAIDGVGFHERGVLFNWGGLPICLSMIAFSYEGHAVFPTLYSSMRDRRQFTKVLIVCFIISTMSYASMGVLGYLMYGQHLASQLILNLPIKNVSTKIAIYTTLMYPPTKYAIVTVPIATAIEEKLLEKLSFGNKRWQSILIRTVLVISTVIIALIIPFFAYVMAFIGALSVTLSMLLPCLCYLKIHEAARRRSGLELIIMIAILINGTLLAIVGIFTSVRQIVNHI